MDILHEIRELLADQQRSAAIGIIRDLDLNQDRSVLRAQVSIWPDEIEIVARVTWDATAPNAGVFMFPSVGDAVLVEYAEDDPDQAFITRRLSSREDTIPETAADGSLVLKAKDGKKSWLTSGTRINLSRGDTEPTENIVLGQIFKATYADHLTKLTELIDKLITQRTTDSTHAHIVLGIPTTAPNQSATMIAERAELTSKKSQIENIKTSKVDSEDILSDVSFTEK